MVHTRAVGNQHAVVTRDWLKDRLSDPDVKVLDATWYMPNTGKKAADDYQTQGRIPGSQFFDIDGVADLTVGLPHMVPSEPAFASAMDALGITNDTFVVLYDRIGYFSAPRAWWTFRIFNHSKVAVLEGGFPEWQAAGLPVDASPADEAAVKLAREAAQSPAASTKYKAALDRSKVRSFEDILRLANSSEDPNRELIMDARSRGRFLGQEPEPRPGLPSGSIPGSKNVPFPSVLEAPGKLKPKEQLQQVFEDAGVDLAAPVVGSCGSGLTACIVALAAYEASGKLIPIYDGSWTEWALKEGTPRVVVPKE